MNGYPSVHWIMAPSVPIASIRIFCPIDLFKGDKIAGAAGSDPTPLAGNEKVVYDNEKLTKINLIQLIGVPFRNKQFLF